MRLNNRYRAAAIALIALGLASSSAFAAQQRCGWYLNPTPGNLLLADKDGHWWITSQGQARGPDAAGADDKAPRFDDKQYVETQPNGRGYGCACLTVEIDRAHQRITRISAGRTIPLARCQADKTLPRPEM